MRVAIVGGTGFVGRYLVEALGNAGHEISIMVRRGSDSRLEGREYCRTVAGDLGAPAALDALLADCNAVIYCVGILREFPRRGITFEALQYAGVMSTVEAAKRQGVSRLLLMSANGVKVPGTAYQETKKRAEDYALASGVDTTIFRPSVIFGDPRGRMEFATQLYREMVAPPLPAVAFFSGLIPERGKILMSPVHVSDVAQAFVDSLADRRTYGRIYHLGGPEVLSWTEMLRRIAEATGRRKWIVPMPVGIMRLAAACLDWLPGFPVTRDQLAMLVEGNTADPGVIESLIRRRPIAFTSAQLAYLAR